MYRSIINEKKAIMPLSLTTMALSIATAFLFLSIYSFVQDHPLKTKTALETLSNSFHQHIQSVETSYYEKQTQFLFKSNGFHSHIELSSNAVIIKEEHNNQQYCVIKKSFVHWWIWSNKSFWNDSISFHQYLKRRYGSNGTIPDPLPDSETIKQEIQTAWNVSTRTVLMNPYPIDTSKPVHIDKIIIYYKRENEEITQKNTQSFILLYQQDS